MLIHPRNNVVFLRHWRTADFITNARRGAWIRIRIHVSNPAGASNSTLKLWIDDTLVLNHTNVNMSTGSYNYWDRGYFFGSQASGSPNSSAIYMDDLSWYESDPDW